MNYLADTDVVVDHLRGRTRIAAKFIKAGLGISLMTYGELTYGAFKSRHEQKSLRLITSFLEDLRISVLPLDKEIILNYGKLKAKLEKQGQRLDEFDLLIAATAITNKLKLVTNNQKHFNRIPDLKLVN